MTTNVISRLLTCHSLICFATRFTAPVLHEHIYRLFFTHDQRVLCIPLMRVAEISSALNCKVVEIMGSRSLRPLIGTIGHVTSTGKQSYPITSVPKSKPLLSLSTYHLYIIPLKIKLIHKQILFFVRNTNNRSTS